MEVFMVVVMILVLATLTAPNMSRMLRAMRLRNATNVVKNQLLGARVRAIANPRVHCGVHFDVTAGRSIVFLDNGPTSPYTYNATEDERYSKPFDLPSGISFSLPPGNAVTDNVVVFRGDGSAKRGGSIQLKDDDNNTRELNVLASTGRIKVLLPSP
jgi:Tfp pilus assembly protein FimT